MCTHVNAKAKVCIRYLPLWCSTLFFKTGSLTNPGAHHFGQVQLSLPLLQHYGCRSAPLCLVIQTQFLMLASTLPTELSPWPQPFEAGHNSVCLSTHHGVSVIPALGRLWQEDSCELKASLGYIMVTGSDRNIQQDTSQNKTNESTDA